MSRRRNNNTNTAPLLIDYESMNVDELCKVCTSKGMDVKGTLIAWLKTKATGVVDTHVGATNTAKNVTPSPKRARRTAFGMQGADTDTEMAVDVRKEPFEAIRNYNIAFNDCFEAKQSGIVVVPCYHKEVQDILSQLEINEIVNCIQNELGRFRLLSDYGTAICHEISTKNSAVDEYQNFHGICESTTDPGCIVVTDEENNRIREISLDGSQPPYDLRKYEEVPYPYGIATCDDGTKDYILSFSEGHEVKRIDARAYEVWTAGKRGNGVHNFLYPLGVAVLPNGQTVVADGFNNRLQILATKTGQFIKQISLPGKNPVGLAYHINSGLLFVTQLRSNNVIAVDITTGTVVRTIGNGRGSELGELDSPRGIALDKYGNLLVADFHNSRVVVFNASDGTPITSFSTPNNPFSVYIHKKSGCAIVGSFSTIYVYGDIHDSDDGY